MPLPAPLHTSTFKLPFPPAEALVPPTVGADGVKADGVVAADGEDVTLFRITTHPVVSSLHFNIGAMPGVMGRDHQFKGLTRFDSA